MNLFFDMRVSSIRSALALVAFSAAGLLSGCERIKSNSVTGEHIPAPSSAGPMDSSKVFKLTLVGYNYTNRYIDDYSVNGTSGANLDVSGPGGGGGKTICCGIAYVPSNLVKQTVKVRWQSAGCVFSTKSTISGEVFDTIHHFFKEAEVELDTQGAHNPKYLEIHIYPDGTVKAAVTDEESAPRLLLDEARKDRSHYPRCQNDKDPS